MTETMEPSNFSNVSSVLENMEYNKTTGATILSPVIMFLTGVCGNIFALCSLYRTRKDVGTTKFYNLITGLAWTDLMGILSTSPSVIAAYMNDRQWIGGYAHCRYHGFAMTCFGLATPLIICAMAVERFIALKCVFFYSTRCKKGTAKGIILILWLLVLWYGVLPLFGFGQFKLQYPGTWCFLDFHSQNITNNVYAYVYASFHLLLMIVMIFCNVYVCVTLFNSSYRRDIDRSRSSSGISEKGELFLPSRTIKSKHSSVEKQMIVLMGAFTTVFVLCWTPLMLQIILTMATGKVNYLWDLTAVRLASLNQTLDPWLYILLRRSLCSNIKRQFRKFRKYRNKHHNELYKIENNIQERVALRRLHYLPHKCGNPDDNWEDLDIPCNCNVRNDAIRDVSLPDVMPIEDLNKIEDKNTLLPDVTNISKHKNTDCHCRLHIGQNDYNKNGEGIYVKIVFVSKSSGESSSSTSSHSCAQNRRHTSLRKQTSSVFQKQNSCRRISATGHETPDNTGSTKETSLAWTFGDGQHRHSEFVQEIETEIQHESLRRSKSHN